MDKILTIFTNPFSLTVLACTASLLFGGLILPPYVITAVTHSFSYHGRLSIIVLQKLARQPRQSGGDPRDRADVRGLLPCLDSVRKGAATNGSARTVGTDDRVEQVVEGGRGSPDDRLCSSEYILSALF